MREKVFRCIGKGGTTIGIKQRHVEWARLEGRDGSDGSIREFGGRNSTDHTILWRNVGRAVDSRTGDSLPGGYEGTGSYAIGLREVEHLWYEADDARCAGFSASVCAGFFERTGRVRKK